jgi:4-carboxymuconolactone decarboxylase
VSQRIHLAAIVMRRERLLLLRRSPAAAWELPGGAFQPHHADPEAGMDAILRELGIESPIADEHFRETVYLPDGDSHMVYNIYAPFEWHGEPQVPAGTGAGWFAPHELESIAMDEVVRESLLVGFGLHEPRDRTGEIMAALTSSGFEPAEGVETEPASLSSPHEAGLDVLRTLTGGEPGAVAARLAEQYPGLADDVVDFALGEVWANAEIDRRTRSLQAVAMLAALGRTGPLAMQIAGALNHGATPGQVVETLRMVAVYAGFPAALEAWPVMERVFERRGVPRPGRPE